MAPSTAGLPQGGVTTHYAIQYDDTLPPEDGLQIALGLCDQCEVDFELMKNWFGDIDLQFAYPIPVGISTGDFGGKWSCWPEVILDFGTVSPQITIGAGTPSSLILVRSILVAEVTEMFMFSQNGGWFEPDGFFSASNEGSKGEGLSRFLAVQLKVSNGLGDVPEGDFAVSHFWVNSSPRINYVSDNPDDPQADATTGCTTLFLYYLNSQLGFSINQIIANSASNLDGVYQKLTGQPDGWTPFNNLVNLHFPPGPTYQMATDNLFPAPNLSQFWAPNPITFGYMDKSAQILIDRPAPADVVIQLKSGDNNIATVRATVTIPKGQSSCKIPIWATLAPASSLSRTVRIEATYAGQTLDIDAQVGPPALVGFTISPSNIEYGQTAIATLTLNLPSKDGDISVLVAGDAGFDGIQQPIVIPVQTNPWQFKITPAINDPYTVLEDEIYAILGPTSIPATLYIRSSIQVGLLYAVTVPFKTVVGGTSFFGNVSLENAVPTDTVISLFAMAPLVPGEPPFVTHPSQVVTVPSSVTIRAGLISTSFLVKTMKPASPTTSVVAVIVGNSGIKQYANLAVLA